MRLIIVFFNQVFVDAVARVYVRCSWRALRTVLFLKKDG